MEELISKYAKIPQQQRWLAIVGAILVIVGGYWYLFASDTGRKISRLEKNMRELQTQANEKRASLANMPRFEAKLVELQQNLEAARSQLPDEANFPEFLAQIGNSARKSGVVIATFNPEGEKKSGVFAEIAASVTLAGSYHEIATFIDSLGRLDRIVSVSNLRLEQPILQNQKIVLQASLEVRTYRYVGGA